MHSELIRLTTRFINENGLIIQIIFELLIFFVAARKTGICDSNLKITNLSCVNVIIYQVARRSSYAHLSSNQNISEVSENVASRNRGKDQKSEESYGGTQKLSGMYI